MWNSKNREYFTAIVGDILKDDKVQSMRELPQHSKCCSCYDHSLYVAYLSFLVCRRLKLDYVAAARGGLLHDFYLCDWEKQNIGLRRLWEHPHVALQNAQERHALSDKEKDIIVKHMWPLTRPLPRHRESFVVSCVDKFCAITEMCWLYRAFRVRKNLSAAMA